MGKPGMFGRDVKHKFRGDSMMISAEWWGSINEQMRKYAVRIIPTKVVDGEQALAAQEKTAKHERVVKIDSTIPAMPPRPKPDSRAVLPSPETLQPVIPKQSQPIPHQNDFAAFPVLNERTSPSRSVSSPPPPVPFAAVELSLSERMELLLQKKVQAASGSLELDSPPFDSATEPEVYKAPPTNPWDNMDTESGGGW